MVVISMSYSVLLPLLIVLLPVIAAREYCYRSGSVRVVNNVAGNNTVEVCRNYRSSLTWHLVCGYGWSCREATVACRQILNVGNPGAILSTSYYSSSTTHYRTSYTCSSGTEQSLSLCSSTSNDACRPSRYYYYRAHHVAHVVCIPPRGCPRHGAIRLVGGETSDTGRLELCFHGEWSVVRQGSFSYKEAAIACKQLGFTEYPRLFTDGRYDLIEPRSYSNIKCNGHEETLLNCQITNSTVSCTSYYSRFSQIGLQCYRATAQCSDGAVRLVGGRIEQEGRVEVCLKGVWGSVCRTQFTMTDINVMCNYLGYLGNRDTFLDIASFGSGEGPILRGYDCQGWEQNMSECFNSSLQYQTKYNSNCQSSWTTAVRCSDFCRTGDVRLVGGPNSTSGIVEFCNNNLWGLIAEPGWSDNNAGVVCKQLGLERGGVAVHNASHLYSRPKKLIHLAKVFCRGSENVISECALFTTSPSAAIDKMNEAEVAGVMCQVPSPTERQVSVSQSFGVHMVYQSPSPALQQSSNFTQSPAGVNMNPSPVPSVQLSASSTAQSLAGLQMDSSPAAIQQYSTSQLPFEVSSSSPTVLQSTSSAKSSVVHMSPSSPAVQQSISTAQLSPGVPSPIVVRQSTSSVAVAQSPTLVMEQLLVSSSQQMMVLQNSLFTISVFMGLNFIMLLLLLGSMAAIAAVLWARTRKASDSAGNLPTADKEKM